MHISLRNAHGYEDTKMTFVYDDVSARYYRIERRHKERTLRFWIVSVVSFVVSLFAFGLIVFGLSIFTKGHALTIATIVAGVAYVTAAAAAMMQSVTDCVTGAELHLLTLHEQALETHDEVKNLSRNMVRVERI